MQSNALEYTCTLHVRYYCAVPDIGAGALDVH